MKASKIKGQAKKQTDHLRGRMELIDSLICMANKAQNPKTKIIVNHSLLMALIFSLRRASLQGVSILGGVEFFQQNRLGVKPQCCMLMSSPADKGRVVLVEGLIEN